MCISCPGAFFYNVSDSPLLSPPCYDHKPQASVTLSAKLRDQIIRIHYPDRWNAETLALIKMVTARRVSQDQPVSEKIPNEKIIDILSECSRQQKVSAPEFFCEAADRIAEEIQRNPQLYESLVFPSERIKPFPENVLSNIVWNSLQKTIYKLLFALTSTQQIKGLYDELTIIYSATMSPGKKLKEAAHSLTRFSKITDHHGLRRAQPFIRKMAVWLTDTSEKWESIAAETENFRESKTLVAKLAALLSLTETLVTDGAAEHFFSREQLAPVLHQLHTMKSLLRQLQCLQFPDENIPWYDWLRELTGIPEINTLLNDALAQLAQALATCARLPPWPVGADIPARLAWLSDRLADSNLRATLRPLICRFCTAEAKVDQIFALFSLASALTSYPAEACVSRQLSWLFALIKRDEIKTLAPLAWLEVIRCDQALDRSCLKLLEMMICPTRQNIEATLQQLVYALGPLLVDNLAATSLPAELMQHLYRCYQNTSQAESWSDMFIRLSGPLLDTLKHYAQSWLIGWMSGDPLCASTLDYALEIQQLSSWEKTLRWFVRHDQSSDKKLIFLYRQYLSAMLLLQVYQAFRASDQQEIQDALRRLAAQLKDHHIVERYPQLAKIIDLLPFLPLFRQAWQLMPTFSPACSWWEWGQKWVQALLRSDHPEFQQLGQLLTHKVEEWLAEALMQVIEHTDFPSLLPTVSAAPAGRNSATLSGSPPSRLSAIAAAAKGPAIPSAFTLAAGVSLEFIGACAVIYALRQSRQQRQKGPACLRPLTAYALNHSGAENPRKQYIRPLPLLAGIIALATGGYFIYRSIARPPLLPVTEQGQARPDLHVVDITTRKDFQTLRDLTEQDADHYSDVRPNMLPAPTFSTQALSGRAKRHHRDKYQKSDRLPINFYLPDNPEEILQTLFPDLADDKNDASRIVLLIIKGSAKHPHVIESGRRKAQPDEKRWPYKGQVKFPLLAIEVIETLNQLVTLQEGQHTFTLSKQTACALKEQLIKLFDTLSAQKYSSLKKYSADHRQNFLFYRHEISQHQFLHIGYPFLIAALDNVPLQQQIKDYVLHLYKKTLNKTRKNTLAGDELLTRLAAHLVKVGQIVCSDQLFISRSDISYLKNMTQLFYHIRPYINGYLADHRPHLSDKISRLGNTLANILTFYDNFYIRRFFCQMDIASVESAFSAPAPVINTLSNDYQVMAQAAVHFIRQRLNLIFNDKKINKLSDIRPFSEASLIYNAFKDRLTPGPDQHPAMVSFLSGELGAQEGREQAADLALVMMQTSVQPKLVSLITSLQQDREPPFYFTPENFSQLFNLNYQLLTRPATVDISDMLALWQRQRLKLNIEEQLFFYKLPLTNERVLNTISAQLEAKQGNSPALLKMFNDSCNIMLNKASQEDKPGLRTFLGLSKNLLTQMLTFKLSRDLSQSEFLTALLAHLTGITSEKITRACSQDITLSSRDTARTAAHESLKQAATEIAFLHDAFDGRRKVAALADLIAEKTGLNKSGKLNVWPATLARPAASSDEEKIRDARIAAIECFLQTDGLTADQAVTIYHHLTRSDSVAAEALLLFTSLYWLFYYEKSIAPVRPFLLDMFVRGRIDHHDRQMVLKTSLMWHLLSPANLLALFLKRAAETEDKAFINRYRATYRSVFSLKRRSDLADQSMANYTAQFIHYRNNDLLTEAKKTAWLQLMLSGIDPQELSQPAKKIWYAQHVNERSIRKAAVPPFPPLDGRANDLCIILTAANNFIVSCTTEGIFAMRYFTMANAATDLQDLPCLRRYSERQLKANLIPFHFSDDEKSVEFFPAAQQSRTFIVALNMLGSAPARWIRHSTLEITAQEKIGVYRFQRHSGESVITDVLIQQYQDALNEIASKMEVLYNDTESTGEKILSLVPFGTIINKKIHDKDYPISATDYAVDSLFLLLSLTDAINDIIQGGYTLSDTFFRQASREGIKKATASLLGELGKNAPSLAKKSALFAVRAFNPIPFTELAIKYSWEKFSRFLAKNSAKRTEALLDLALARHKEHLYDSIFSGQQALPDDACQPGLLHAERYNCIDDLLCWRKSRAEEEPESLGSDSAANSASVASAETGISSDSLPSLESYPTALFDAPVEVEPALGDRATLVADMQEQGMEVYGAGFTGLKNLPGAEMKRYAEQAFTLLPQVKSKIIKAITAVEKAKAGDEAVKRALHELITPLINSDRPDYIETVLNNFNARNKAINRLNITKENLFFYQEQEEVGMPRTIAFIHPRDAKRTIFINMAHVTHQLQGSLIHEISHFAGTKDLLYLKNSEGAPDTLAGLQLNRDYNIAYPENTLREFFNLSEEEEITDALRQQFLNTLDDPWWRTRLVANNADCHADLVMKIDNAFTFSPEGELYVTQPAARKRSVNSPVAAEKANASMLSGLIKLFTGLVYDETAKSMQQVIF